MTGFETPQEHIDWAKTRIDAAEEAFARYAQDGAITPVTEFDAEAGERVFKIRLVKALPMEITGPLRNALLDIKHSFDQSLFAAAQSHRCFRFAQNYPWADSLAGVEGIIDKRQSKPKSALPQVIIDEITRQKPHEAGPRLAGGEYLIREVAKLANDKHTIGFRTNVSLTGMKFSNAMFSGSGSFLSPWDPEKQEMVIARLEPGGHFSYDDCTFGMDIFFDRAGDVGKIPVLVAARLFADHAQHVLEGFKAICT
ncbi:hypothetical protein [Novosphingobium sp.]|uniref:hypothetical protein n=1 Tax=Novosphingobium sp. TaxID=1874826 RepID=UPI0038BC8604